MKDFAGTEQEISRIHDSKKCSLLLYVYKYRDNDSLLCKLCYVNSSSNPIIRCYVNSSLIPGLVKYDAMLPAVYLSQEYFDANWQTSNP